MAAAAAGCGVFTHNTTAEVHTNTTALDNRRWIVFSLKLLELIYLQLIKKYSTLMEYSQYSLRVPNCFQSNKLMFSIRFE